MESKRKLIIIGIILVVIIITVAVVVPTVLVSRNQNSDAENDSTIESFLEQSLNQLHVFPTTSYKANLKQFDVLSNSDYAFLSLDQTLLRQVINIDDTSLIFEAGRRQYLYFRIPSVLVRSENVIDITGIGLHFGNDPTNLTIIPIQNNLFNTPGVDIVPTNLTDGSKLIRLHLKLPSTLCFNLSVPNSCTEVQYSAYLIFSGNQRSDKPYQSLVNIGCGDICSNSSKYAACSASCVARCIEYELGNTDAPVSRRYHMGRQDGTFQFVYDTFQGNHRFKVWNGYQLLFDTGCIVAYDAQYIWLALYNQSFVRVDVEPNCHCTNIQECTQGHWYFDIGCALPCPFTATSNSTSNLVRIESNGIELSSGTILYIDENARMPQLVALSCESVSWHLSFSYHPDTLYAPRFSYEFDLDSQGNRPLNLLSPLRGKAAGGNVVISWTTYAMHQTGRIHLTILGTQPQHSLIMEYINNSTDLWYAKNIVAYESAGGTQFTGTGYPYYFGILRLRYGIYQIANPSYEEIWDWKANVNRGVSLLQSKQDSAKIWMNQQRTLAKQDTGIDQRVPDRPVGKYCLFSDTGNRTISDAVAMKLFNENNLDYYCAWDNKNHVWQFNPLNSRSQDYVELVCNQEL